MKIAIVTVWYNEEDLAPFFLKHYSYVDDIYVYIDKVTNDSTRKICEEHSNVTIRGMSFPAGFDDILKVNRINSAVRALKHDWVFAVDADELIQQPKQYESAKEFLSHQQKQGYNLVIAKMFQVYRHVTDEDLDISKPVLPQRSHGDPDFSKPFNRCYIKPIVVRPGVGISWSVGCHSYRANKKLRVAKEQFFGAHWKMADPELAVKRRMRNKARLSKRQKAKNRSYQDIRVTKKVILKELKQHSHNPKVL